MFVGQCTIFRRICDGGNPRTLPPPIRRILVVDSTNSSQLLVLLTAVLLLLLPRPTDLFSTIESFHLPIPWHNFSHPVHIGHNE
jgi:hypothetical protein